VVEGMSGHLGQMMRLRHLDPAVPLARRGTSIAIAQAASVPLVLPTGTRGLWRGIAPARQWPENCAKQRAGSWTANDGASKW
jgi:hypothetical protein